MSKWSISRRTMLRGLGAGIALPFLDAMAPAGGLGRLASAAESLAGGAAAAASPVRMALFFLPNGMNYTEWVPGGEGKEFKLSSTLAPLEKVKDDLTVLTG